MMSHDIPFVGYSSSCAKWKLWQKADTMEALAQNINKAARTVGKREAAALSGKTNYLMFCVAEIATVVGCFSLSAYTDRLITLRNLVWKVRHCFRNNTIEGKCCLVKINILVQKDSTLPDCVHTSSLSFLVSWCACTDWKLEGFGSRSWLTNTVSLHYYFQRMIIGLTTAMKFCIQNIGVVRPTVIGPALFAVIRIINKCFAYFNVKIL